MYKEFCIQQRKRANEHLAVFLEANPAYSLDDEQPRWLKGTHLVAFGSYRQKPAVFKYYDGDPRKEHEKKALELFAPTGLVPELWDETDLMVVMQRLPGLTMCDRERQLNPAEMHELYCRLGEAVRKIVETAPGTNPATRHESSFRASDLRDFYNTPYDALHVLYRQASTAVFLDTTLARADRVLRDRDVARKDVLRRSLAALQRNRDAILSYADFVHMDDFHTNNIMVEGTRITGFIDLEMTRYGNESCFSPRRSPACANDQAAGGRSAAGTKTLAENP